MQLKEVCGIMISLDDPLWNDLRYAYGSASKIPQALHYLRAAATANIPLDFEAAGDVWEICHQWSTYDSTYATLPHLTSICASAVPDSEIRLALLKLYGWATACLRLNKTRAPKLLIDAFESSIPPTRELIRESLRDIGAGSDLRPLLGALAVCSGDAELGLVMYELYEGTFYCDNCGTLIQPMRTGFNPFCGRANGT